MTTKRESLQSKIKRLRQSFFGELPKRLYEIELDFQTFRLNPENTQVLNELHRKIHNIKGSAASFGLTELSLLATQAEIKLKEIQDGTINVDELILANIHFVLQQLQAQVKTVEAMELSSSNEQVFPAFELTPETLGTEYYQHNQLIYICDDDELLLKSLQIQLSCFSYSTRIFSDSESLLKAVKEQIPAAIIMDIVFPDGEQAGIDCINKLQQLDGHNIPVIFISARNDFEARLYSVRAGGAAYFTKPFKVMDLVDMLDNVLNTAEAKPQRILIIDDDEKMAEYHRLILEEVGMSVSIINNANKVLEIIFDYKPDLILMDMYMPVCNGSELAQVIRQIPEFLSLPIVYLSSETDAKKQFSALRVGADGFLTKPIDPERLISEVLLRTERMSAMRSLMVQDSLTGLLNHTTILNILKTAIANAQRRNEPLCFIMLDIDYFKQVNDVHGHAIGDQVLLALARLMRQRIRNSDFVGRYGGEEFAIVLQNIGLNDAEKLSNELRNAFNNISFNSKQGEFSCSLSGGISSFPGFTNIQDMVNSADKALYTAKSNGRNNIVLASRK